MSDSLALRQEGERPDELAAQLAQVAGVRVVHALLGGELAVLVHLQSTVQSSTAPTRWCPASCTICRRRRRRCAPWLGLSRAELVVAGPQGGARLFERLLDALPRVRQDLGNRLGPWSPPQDLGQALDGLPVVLNVPVRADVAVQRVLELARGLVEVVAQAHPHDVRGNPLAVSPDDRDDVPPVARQLRAAVARFARHVHPRHLHRPISRLAKALRRSTYPFHDPMRAQFRPNIKASFVGFWRFSSAVLRAARIGLACGAERQARRKLGARPGRGRIDTL